MVRQSEDNVVEYHAKELRYLKAAMFNVMEQHGVQGDKLPNWLRNGISFLAEAAYRYAKNIGPEIWLGG